MGLTLECAGRFVRLPASQSPVRPASPLLAFLASPPPPLSSTLRALKPGGPSPAARSGAAVYVLTADRFEEVGDV